MSYFHNKITITKIINTVGLEIQTEIANEVKQGNIALMDINRTMDISSYDQCVHT